MQVAICTSLFSLWAKMPKIWLENPELLLGGDNTYTIPNQIFGDISSRPPGFGAYGSSKQWATLSLKLIYYWPFSNIIDK